MTEEEKKAIDILINEIADIVVGEYCTHCKICENEDTECYYTKTIDTVYNLINKQQKEIEQLRDTNKKLYETGRQRAIQVILSDNWVSKDKIREIISKYVDIEEQLNYSSNELFGGELTNMIKELLKE